MVKRVEEPQPGIEGDTGNQRVEHLGDASQHASSMEKSPSSTTRNQSQTTQETRHRGPGSLSKASRVVSPVPMA